MHESLDQIDLRNLNWSSFQILNIISNKFQFIYKFIKNLFIIYQSYIGLKLEIQDFGYKEKLFFRYKLNKNSS